MKTIGFIGLGNMGRPMAANLVKAGLQVKGFDMSPDACNQAKDAGVVIGSSGEDVVRGAEVVITMLPSGQHTLKVYAALLPHASPDTVFLDCSTIDVKSARQAHSQAAQADMKSLDAPVSGGVGGAEAGSLTFMVGGDEGVYQSIIPLFEIMGAKSVLCGGAGAGQAAKICNNMLLAISMIGSCEAFSLAEKLGLDQKALFDVISTSSGYCWSVNTYCPVPGVGPHSPADNNYQPGFASSLMLKDLMLGMQAARDVSANTPLGAHAAELYDAFVQEGNGNVDFSSIIKSLK